MPALKMDVAGSAERKPSPRELGFFNLIRQFCNVLDLPQLYEAAVDLYKRQRDDIKRYTNHSAAALVYLVAKSHRPQLLLADVCDKLRLPLNKTNTVVQRIKHASLENNAVLVPDFPKYDIKDQVEGVYSRLINILNDIFWVAQHETMSKDAQQAVRTLTLQILKIVKRSGMELGRHSRPIVAAAMIFAARCLSNYRSRPCVEDWEAVAVALKYNKSTLIQRYREVVNYFSNRARLVPWAATDASFKRHGKHRMTKKGFSYEQLMQLTGEDTDRLLDWKEGINESQPSVEHHPPSFAREYRKTEARIHLVTTVQNMIRGGDCSLPNNATMEMQVIYLLLKNHVSAEELCLLDESQLLQRFIKSQQRRHLEHDLDQPELCDWDLSEEEAKTYLH